MAQHVPDTGEAIALQGQRGVGDEWPLAGVASWRVMAATPIQQDAITAPPVTLAGATPAHAGQGRAWRAHLIPDRPCRATDSQPGDDRGGQVRQGGPPPHPSQRARGRGGASELVGAPLSFDKVEREERDGW